jgi:hypothetical protein
MWQAWLRNVPRAPRAPWGALTALLAAALAAAGCQDDYPLAATRCDHWCELRKATECGTYNPAACVVACEQVSGGPACYPQFDDLLSCLREHEQELVCDFSGQNRPCESEQARLIVCADLPAPQGPGSAE